MIVLPALGVLFPVLLDEFDRRVDTNPISGFTNLYNMDKLYSIPQDCSSVAEAK